MGGANNQPLAKPLRSQLENTVKSARDVAEKAALAALRQLAVGEAKAPDYLSDELKALRRRLRAHGRALGDVKAKDDTQGLQHLVWEVAYEHWHRMLFARFLADNNLLTLGVTTRFLDPDTGAEALRLGIAQRLRFSDQNVTLDNTPVGERVSDVLLGAGINWTPQWGFDSTVQYNPKTRRSIRSTIGGRYSPGNYKVVSAAYRLQRGLSEQIDMGWQWPIGDHSAASGEGRWYSVGRLNYSLQDRKLVDSVVGFEYDAGCWLGRVVVERLQSSTSSSNKRILFQLEFVGFTRLGSNALQTLKDNIPRYQYLREKTTTPSRFSNYD